MPRILVFDVNETLLDLAPLDPLFERAFGDKALRGAWFAQMLQLAFVGGLTGRYVDFPGAQRAALSMLAESAGVEPGADVADELARTMRRLPPHPEVDAALERLGAGGFTLAALTNSPLDVAREQLEHAGLYARFDGVFSADQVRALKPRAEAYGLVADHYGVQAGELRLIAAHAWDVSGALAAGCAAAFVRRPGRVLSPLGDRPDIVGDDLAEVADQLLAGARALEDPD
jgi:2-haloacid dehalogenase